MDYFSILNLEREPFSNSPDPEYFFHSRQHLDCLQKLELSLHLRRGLNLIIGDVGTGKTTLCRQIIRRFAQRKEVETHLVLDPVFKDGGDFLAAVARLLAGKPLPEGTSDWQAKELIKHHLFRKGVDQKKITVLIIDEGQKIPTFCLEILREFLNYETNDYKLLQIVIFAQTEFESVIRSHPNFADRINLRHYLRPLSFSDTRMMIRFRLEKSSSSKQNLDLFTLPALVAIYRRTGGFPRKIINLCHQCILAMIIQNRRKVGWGIVRRCSERVFRTQPRRRPRWALALGVIAVAAVAGWQQPWTQFSWKATGSTPAAVRQPIARLSLEPVPPPETAAAPPTEASPVVAEASASAPAAALAAPTPQPVVESGGEPASPPFPPPLPAAPAVKPVDPAPLMAATAPTASKADTRSSPPESLGKISLRRNETVSGLIQRVYGYYSNRLFRSIILANPQIDDPDRVLIGQQILLPAVAVAVTPPGREVWWVKVGETDSLQEAYDQLRDNPEAAPPVRLIPYWQPATGTRFALVLKQSFSNSKTAEMQLRLLSPERAATGVVVASWGENAVLFADPYYAAK